MPISKIPLSKKDPLTIDFLGLHSIENDIQFCEEYLKLLVKMKSDLPNTDSTNDFTTEKYLIQSVSFTFVILYMKMFAGGTRTLNFNPEEVYINHPDYLRLHKQLREYRSHYIAHSVNFKGEELSGVSMVCTHQDAIADGFHYQCKPDNKRGYSLNDKSIPYCIEMLNVCREYWQVKHDEIVLKILPKYLPQHLEELKPYLLPHEFEQIKQEFTANNVQITTQYNT